MRRERGPTVKLRVTWMTRKDQLPCFHISSDLRLHIDTMCCTQTFVFVLLLKRLPVQASFPFALRCCVPTHAEQECDIFCVLALIWAEELC